MKFKKYDVQTDGGKWLKIGPGETVTMILRGDIYEELEWQKWVNGQAKKVPPGTKGASPKFQVNAIVYNAKEKKFECKIFGFGLMIYRELEKIANHYTIEEIKIAVTRTGTGLNTEWEVIALAGKQHEISPTSLEMIEQVPLHILGEKKADDVGSPPPAEEGDPGFDSIPF